MRRFTDSVLFLALFVLAALAWLILANTGGVPDAAPGRIAPMTVGAVVVIACPALLVATLLGVVRALSGTSARRFYTWGAGTAVLSSAVVALASVPAERQGVEVGFEWMAWYFGILALAFVIALVVALTGGIPSPEARSTESGAPATTPQAQPPSESASRKAAPPSSVREERTPEVGAGDVPPRITDSGDLTAAQLPGSTAPDPAIHGTTTDPTTTDPTTTDRTTPREPLA